jgi:hypothetical protein
VTEIVDFEIEHILGLDLQPMQSDEDPRALLLDPENQDKLDRLIPHAWSLTRNGQVVGSVGMVCNGDHWMAWAMLSEKALEDGDGLTRAVRGLIEYVRPRDLPLRATAAFPRAERWLERLGFEHREGEEWEWVQPAQ